MTARTKATLRTRAVAVSERRGLWCRVGRLVRARRLELGLSQGDVIQRLGYKSRNSVSNVEVGIEGIALRKAFAWADVLGIAREPFFRFVTGELDRLGVGRTQQGRACRHGVDPDLLALLSRLPARLQRRLFVEARRLAESGRQQAWRKGRRSCGPRDRPTTLRSGR